MIRSPLFAAVAGHLDKENVDHIGDLGRANWSEGADTVLEIDLLEDLVGNREVGIKSPHVAVGKEVAIENAVAVSEVAEVE
jgi:hypothetical protein